MSFRTIAGLAALVGGTAYVLRMQQFSDQLYTEVSFDDEFTIEGYTLKTKLHVTLRNPTQGQMTLQYPSVAIRLGETPLANSTLQGHKRITIKPYSSTTLAPMELTLKAQDGAAALMEIIPFVLRRTNELPLIADIRTDILVIPMLNLGLPYREEVATTLRRKNRD